MWGYTREGEEMKSTNKDEGRCFAADLTTALPECNPDGGCHLIINTPSESEQQSLHDPFICPPPQQS